MACWGAQRWQHAVQRRIPVAHNLPHPSHQQQPSTYGTHTHTPHLHALCSIKAQATIMELLEESGLPALCATMVLQQDAQARLGQLLAEAVKEQRSRSNPKQQLWEGSRRVVDSKAGLDPVEQVVGRQAAQRLVEVRRRLRLHVLWSCRQ